MTTAAPPYTGGTRARRRPPGPRDFLFGTALWWWFRGDPLAFVTRLSRSYGDVVYVRLGHYPTYFIFHPELIKEVLVAKASSFRRSRLQKRVLSSVDGNGLALSDGEFWLRQRRLVQPGFHAKRVRDYARTIVECTARMLDRWEVAARAGGRFETDVAREMTDLALENIARALFGEDVSGDARRLGETVAVLSRALVWEAWLPLPVPQWLPLPILRRKRRALAVVDGKIREMIRHRRQSGTQRDDLLSMLLLAVDEEGDGSGMTDEQARDEAMVMFLAGHDTTAAGLAWVWHLLGRHPAAQERAAAEVSAALGGCAPAAEDLPRLPFLDCVVKEALRLYPPAYAIFLREAAENVEIGGWRLPKGSLAHIFPWVPHHDPRWFPEPDRFDPDRFSAGREESIPPYAYLPFGGGPRTCIGKSLAMTEMVLVAACVLQRFRLAPAPGWGEVVAAPLMSLRPRGGVQMLVTRRSAGK